MSNRVPDWLLERLARNDLPAEEAARVRARLSAEPQGAARLAALGDSDREILAALPAQTVAAEVQRRMAGKERSDAAARGGRARGYTALSLALGAAALGAFVIARPSANLAPSVVGEAEDVIREKGLRPQLRIYRRQSEEAQRLEAGTQVRPGDVLQLAYVSAGQRYGVIVSVDARGTVTPHLPETGGPAARLAPNKETKLDRSYALDDSPGFERFLFISANTPFASELVAESLRPGGAPLSSDFSTVEITLRKDLP